MWAAFECAALAGYTGDDKQAERLFQKGHQNGVLFIGAAQADKSHQKQIMEKVPLIVSWHLGGPSPDFMIGRVWEATNLYVEDELNERSTWTHQAEDLKSPVVDAEIRKMRAENKFREGHCASL